MINEEAIKVLKTYDMNEENDDTGFKNAIALELQSLSPKVDLEKIRDEILNEGLYIAQFFNSDIAKGMYRAAQIIENYTGLESKVSEYAGW